MTSIINILKALEAERCRCIVEQNFQRLGELLSASLIHTHTRGNVDTRESYLAYVSGIIESLELRREGLQVVPIGDSVAVMHGKQINRARRRGHQEEVVVEAVVTQVWTLESVSGSSRRSMRHRWALHRRLYRVKERNHE